MNQTELKVKNLNSDYSIIIGNNVLNILPKKIKILCPKAEKIAIALTVLAKRTAIINGKSI